jgi:haloacid dehalogenase superfamily, subfamily IA, variant 3 with third motif having DD or ED
MIKNIIFDFGQVLVAYDFNKYLPSIFNDKEEMSKFKAIFCGDEFVNRCDKGDQTFLELIRSAQKEYPHWKKELQQFHDTQLDVLTGEVPGMRDLILRLKDGGYRVFGLTNWSETVYPVLEKYSILSLLEGRIISSEERMIKPDPAIFLKLLEKFSLKAGDCLFTDDKLPNVEGAKSVGMDAVVFKDARQFEEELKKRGVLA